MVAIRRAKPKKSSARRKKPRWVRLAHDRRRSPARARTPASVASSAASAEPAVVALAAIASASSRVDLPEPFSPTRIVTGWSSTRSDRVAIAGTSNGKAGRAASPWAPEMPAGPAWRPADAAEVDHAVIVADRADPRSGSADRAGPTRSDLLVSSRPAPRRRPRRWSATARRPSLRRSSVVERAAVNRLVVSSNLTAGATPHPLSDPYPAAARPRSASARRWRAESRTPGRTARSSGSRGSLRRRTSRSSPSRLRRSRGSARPACRRGPAAGRRSVEAVVGDGDRARSLRPRVALRISISRSPWSTAARSGASRRSRAWFSSSRFWASVTSDRPGSRPRRAGGRSR